MYILFYIQRHASQKESFESIFHTSLEDQDKIRDLRLQPVSNGCQIDSLIPNTWINDLVINPFLKEASKTSSYSNAVFSIDIFQNILGRRLNQECQNALVDSYLLQRDVIAIPVFHKDSHHWSMASIYRKLKVILHFDLKHSVYLDVFQAVLYLLKQNSQQTGICFDENQWTLVSPNIIPFQNDDCNCEVFACMNVFNARNIKYNKYQETDASMFQYWIASIAINLNIQPRKQTSDRIKNIEIIEKPRFGKLEVVRPYKNTASHITYLKQLPVVCLL